MSDCENAEVKRARELIYALLEALEEIREGRMHRNSKTTAATDRAARSALAERSRGDGVLIVSSSDP